MPAGRSGAVLALCAAGALASVGADPAAEDLQLARDACGKVLRAAARVPQEGRAYEVYQKCRELRPTGGLLSASSSPEGDCADFARLYQTAAHYRGGFVDIREFCNTAESLRRPDTDPALDPLIAKHRACVSDFGNVLASGGVQAAVRASCLRLYPWPDGPNITRKKTCTRYAEEVALSVGTGVVDALRICDRVLTGNGTFGLDAKHFVYSCERYAHNLVQRAKAGESWEALEEEGTAKCTEALHNDSGSFCEEYVRLVHEGTPGEIESRCRTQYRKMQAPQREGEAEDKVKNDTTATPQDDEEQAMPLSPGTSDAATADKDTEEDADEEEEWFDPAGAKEWFASDAEEEDEPIPVGDLSTEPADEEEGEPLEEEPQERILEQPIPAPAPAPKPPAPAAAEPKAPFASTAAVIGARPAAVAPSHLSEGKQHRMNIGGSGAFRMNAEGARLASDPFGSVLAGALRGVASPPELRAAAQAATRPAEAQEHNHIAAPPASHAGTGRYGKFLDSLRWLQPSLLASTAPDASADAGEEAGTAGSDVEDRDGDFGLRWQAEGMEALA